MKSTVMYLAIVTVIISACGGNQPKEAQSNPRDLAEAIFEAARTENYQGLPALIAADAY